MNELIDISRIDAMSLDLRLVIEHLKADDLDVVGQMVKLLEMEARATILGGVAVDPCLAVGLNSANQISPSQIFSDGEAGFVGRFSGVGLVDFTAAIERDETLSKLLKTGGECITHGLVFRPETELEDAFCGQLRCGKFNALCSNSTQLTV